MSSVDAIFTWVDGNDPSHYCKREHYRKEDSPKGDSTFATSATVESRFADRGEIYYSIHLLRKFAPWVARIHLITDQQRPSWLSESIAQKLNINVVDHQTLFSGHENHLPSFNSFSLETLLHRIPGIADRFLYFCDDFFLIRPVYEADFFMNNKPVFQAGNIIYSNFFQQKLQQVQFKFKRVDPDGIFFLGSIEGPRLQQRLKRIVYIAHCPFPAYTHTYARIMNRRIPQNIINRFRSDSQFIPLSLYASILDLLGQCKFVASQSRSFSHTRQPNLTVDKIRRRLALKRVKFASFQSIDLYDDDSQKTIFQYLESLL